MSNTYWINRKAPEEPLELTAARFELDTLELARRGRQEQARVIAELTSAGVKRLAAFGRKVFEAVGELLSARTAHGLKGN